jgi:hypothetical protein
MGSQAERKLGCQRGLKRGQVKTTELNDYMRNGFQAMESRRGRGELIKGFTQGVRRFRMREVNRHVDVDTILEKVISFGVR